MSTPTLRLHRTDGGPDNAHAITPENWRDSQFDGVLCGFAPAQDGSAKTFELAERANVLSSINEERNESDQQG